MEGGGDTLHIPGQPVACAAQTAVSGTGTGGWGGATVRLRGVGRGKEGPGEAGSCNTFLDHQLQVQFESGERGEMTSFDRSAHPRDLTSSLTL